MKQTKIEWCDCTINPVVGCPRGCEYCYARKMNTRFKWIEDFSKPQFFPERLKQLESKKPKSIFMNSMSDVTFWTEEQIKEIFKAADKNPQHKYILLSKTGHAYQRFLDIAEQVKPINKPWFAFGLTITKNADFINNFPQEIHFLSIEPILEKVDLIGMEERLNVTQIIIGAETGNRKGKVIPKKEWIDSLVKQADKYEIRVFMKNSLKPIMGDDFRQDKLIWEE